MPSLSTKPLTLYPKHGFTLIELLIVLTVLGILAGLALASYGGVQEKARDSKRKQELTAIKKALNLYADNNNGVFPGQPALCVANTVGSTWNITSGTGCDLDTILVPTYMSKVPIDPKANTNGPPAQHYAYSSNMWCNAGYSDPNFCNAGRVAIYTYLENSKDPDRGDAALFGYDGAGRREYILLVDE